MDKPFDIFNKHWPPEVQEQTGLDCEDTLVPEIIVSLLNQSELSRFWNDKLMLAMWFTLPERTIQDKEAGQLEERLVVLVQHTIQAFL